MLPYKVLNMVSALCSRGLGMPLITLQAHNYKRRKKSIHWERSGSSTLTRQAVTPTYHGNQSLTGNVFHEAAIVEQNSPARVTVPQLVEAIPRLCRNAVVVGRPGHRFVHYET